MSGSGWSSTCATASPGSLLSPSGRSPKSAASAAAMYPALRKRRWRRCGNGWKKAVMSENRSGARRSFFLLARTQPAQRRPISSEMVSTISPMVFTALSAALFTALFRWGAIIIPRAAPAAMPMVMPMANSCSFMLSTSFLIFRSPCSRYYYCPEMGKTHCETRLFPL